MLVRKSLISVFIVLFVASLLAFAAPQTFTGIVTDTMCGKKHMMPGKSDAECVRECMKTKGDWTYGLVVGDKVYSLSGDKKQFDAFAGQRVKVTGDVAGSKIAVQAINAAK
ncbi:MAG: hypothetical protein ACR2IF_13765 [Terriglobales bacterium]